MGIEDDAKKAVAELPSRAALLRLEALAWALNGSFYLLLGGIAVLFVGLVAAAVVLFGRLGLLFIAFPAGVFWAGLRPAIGAAVPRRRRARLVGVPMSREDQPSLWSLVDDVCEVTGQPGVDELRVTLAESASASEIGPRFRRVLALPLAYLVALGDRELKAVIAHELFHFDHGDVGFSRRLATVYDALGRTLSRLEGLGSILRYPFRWYARAVFRVLASLSRARELRADAYAAGWFGAEASARTLRITEWVGTAFAVYWRGNLARALDEGVMPPLAAGFASYIASLTAHGRLHDFKPAEDDQPFASHPTVVDRLTALGADATAEPEPLEPVLRRIIRLPDLEQALLRSTAGERAGNLRRSSWSEAMGIVLAALWQATAVASASVLTGARAQDLAGVVDGREGPEDDHASVEREHLADVLACGVASALVRAGWSIEAPPGEPVTLTNANIRSARSRKCARSLTACNSETFGPITVEPSGFTTWRWTHPKHYRRSSPMAGRCRSQSNLISIGAKPAVPCRNQWSGWQGSSSLCGSRS